MESIAAVEDVRKRSKRVNATFELESASARVSVEMALRPTSAMFTVRAAPHESRGYGPANDLVTALDQLAARGDHRIGLLPPQHRVGDLRRVGDVRQARLVDHDAGQDMNRTS